MTSEPDNTSGRRPPTIELTATEVEASASAPGSSAPDSAGGASANTGADRDASRAARGTSGWVASHVMSVVIGAIAMAAIVAGLWIAGVVPSRDIATPAPVAAPVATSPQFEHDMSARLDKIERTIQTQKPDPALANRLAAVEAQSKSLADSIAALTHRLDDVAAASISAEKQADTAQATAEAAKNSSQATSQSAAQKSDLDALASQITALDSAVKGLSDNAAHPTASANDQAARLTIAAEALRATVERGAPYQAELAAVQALGVDKAKIAPLEPFAATGVPTAEALAHELASLAPALTEAVEPKQTQSTFLDRIKSSAEHLVRSTSIDAPVGDDAQSIAMRINFDATHGQIDAALTDIAKLPDAGKAIVAPWAQRAQARNTAIAASRKLSANALAALGKPQ